MVNTDDFVKRLETLLEYYGVSASAFADSIGVQRSALSHLMSGRNKPSLDLIMKVVEAYPEVDIYWLLNGKGNFPKENVPEKNIHTPPALGSQEQPVDLFSFNEEPSEDNINLAEENNKFVTPPASSTDIEQIVIFYRDGSFKKYRPQ